MAQRVIPIRASSFPDLLDCPARWEAQQLKGMRVPGNAKAHLGTSVHKALELYDKARMNGGGGIEVEEAQERFVATMISGPKDGVVWDEGEYEKAEANGLELVRKYAEKVAPNRNYVGVEVDCAKVDVMVDGMIIRLSGHIDRIRHVEGVGLGVGDLKTGEQAVRANETVDVDKHMAQIGVYEILAAFETGEQMAAPAEIVGLQANGKTRVAVGEMSGAAELVLGSEESPGLLNIAAGVLKSGLFWGNPRSLFCGPKYCPLHAKCRFRAKA